MLERIELSRADPITSSNSLLPPSDVIQTIIDHEPNETSIYEANPEDDLISSISLDQGGAEVAEKHFSNLQRIFQVYCAYGDPLNMCKMKSSNLLKLLKNSGLLGESKGLGALRPRCARKERNR